MYNYVEDKEFLFKAQTCCSNMMKQLEERLRKKGTNIQYFLIGSGARNMVTKNEDGPIDFDYNLNIFSTDNWDEKAIKEKVRLTFNSVLKENGIGDCSDSTSSLTTKNIYFTKGNDTEFSIDLAIVTKKDGLWHRLIHDKHCIPNRYYWVTALNSSDYKEKGDAIKTIPGAWKYVRDAYLNKKNMYLSRNDENHPSFICFIEAVNEVYKTLKDRNYL